MSTKEARYTQRLLSQSTWWKRLLDVQRPYRRHLQHLRLGLVLEVGCGIGRNLINLGGRGSGVGVDHNAYSVAVARSRGLIALTPEEFRASPYAEERGFDSLLLSHVVEHLHVDGAAALLREYLGYLRPGGRVVLITPQEAGYKSDRTHLTFVDHRLAALLLEGCGLEISRQYSFPLPRFFGWLFKYNEFVTIGEKAA
ncbi:MAG: class I SAM-dependent methyltransferase [Thermoanaerobaculia bacterium]|jgi:SAM-dependent methyltransferase